MNTNLILKTEMEWLPKILKYIRVIQEIELKDLAERTGINISELTQIESGEKEIGYFQIDLICQNLNIKQDFLKQLLKEIVVFKIILKRKFSTFDEFMSIFEKWKSA